MAKKKRKSKAKKRKKRLSMQQVARHHFFSRAGEIDADLAVGRDYIDVGGAMLHKRQANRIMKEWQKCRIIN